MNVHDALTCPLCEHVRQMVLSGELICTHPGLGDRPRCDLCSVPADQL